MRAVSVPVAFALVFLCVVQSSDLLANGCQAGLGAEVDLCTQKGGIGSFSSCPPYCVLEKVELFATVMYNSYPEQNSDVAFQMIKPAGDCFVLSGRTNSCGVASASFCLPDDCGGWMIVATVDVGVVVNDTLCFETRWNLADFNSDHFVDLFDAITLLGSYGAQRSDEEYTQDLDIARPYGYVNLYDAIVFCANYGERRRT